MTKWDLSQAPNLKASEYLQTAGTWDEVEEEGFKSLQMKLFDMVFFISLPIYAFTLLII